MALKVGELFASFNVDTTGAMAQVGNLITKVGDLESAYITLGNTMTRVLTQNIVKGAKSAITATMNFDSAMAEVASVSKISTDSDAFARLREQALMLAGSTKYTANEVAQALYYMGLAGWDTEQMMAGLPGLLAMGAASGENLSTVSDILTDDITAMGDSAQDATRYANIFAAASSSSNTTITQMGEAMKYVGALAGTLGFSMEDVALALGLMANNGIKGSQAGTALRRILSNLAAPTKSSAAAMDALGLSLEDGEGGVISLYDYMLMLRGAFSDFGSTRVMQTISEALALDESDEKLPEYLTKVKMLAIEVGADLSEIDLDDMSVAEQIQAISEAVFDLMLSTGEIAQLPAAALAKDLAGQYGLAALLAIINTTDEDMQSLHDSIYASGEGEGAAFTMAETQLDNLQGKITLLKSAWETLQIDITDNYTPAFQGLIEKITEMVQGFTALPDDVKKTTVEMLGLAAATGPMLLAIGMVSKYAQLLSPLLTGMFTPMGLMVGTAMLFGASAIDDDNSVGEMMETMSTFIAEKLDQLAEYISSNTPEISGRMGNLITSLTNVISTMTPALGEVGFTLLDSLITSLSDNAEGLLGIGTSLITTLVDSVTNNIDTLPPDVLTAVTTVISALAGKLPEIAGSLGNFGGQLISTLTTMLVNPETYSKLYDMGVALLKGIALGMVNGAKGILSGVYDSIITFMSSLFGESKEDVEAAYGDWAEDFDNVGVAGIEFMLEAAEAGTPQSIEDLQQLLYSYEEVVDNVPGLAYKFQDYSYLFNDGAMSLLKVIDDTDDLDQISAALYALNAMGFSDLFDALIGENDYTDYSGLTLAELLEKLGLGTDVIETADEIADAVDQATESATTLSEKEAAIYETLGSISSELGLSETEGGSGIATAITNGTNAVQTAAEQLGSDAVNAALKALSYDEGYNVGWNFVTGIVTALQAGASYVSAAAANISSQFSASVSVSTNGGSTGTTAALGGTTKLLDKLANRPVVLVQDGKTVAKINTANNSAAMGSFSQKIALGYGQ